MKLIDLTNHAMCLSVDSVNLLVEFAITHLTWLFDDDNQLNSNYKMSVIFELPLLYCSFLAMTFSAFFRARKNHSDVFPK